MSNLFSETLIRVSRKIDNLAESKGMTRKEFEDWSKRETYRQEISEQEIMVIRAYQLDQAIKKIKINKRQEELRKTYFWIERFRSEFFKIDKYIKHLTDVCGYIKDRYDYEYYWESLLNLDNAEYEELSTLSKRRSIKI